MDFTLGSGSTAQTLGTFANGTTVRCFVRARTSEGTEETNTNEVAAVADSAAPTPPVTISAE